MLKSFAKKLTLGVAYGATYLVFMLILGFLFNWNGILTQIWNNFIPNALGSMFVGIGFFAPTIVYDTDLKIWKKLLIHLLIGQTFFLVTAFTLQWMPPAYNIPFIVLYIVVSFTIFFIIWFSFYLYHRSLVFRMNQKLKSLNE